MACWYCDPSGAATTFRDEVAKSFKLSCARCRTVGISYAPLANQKVLPAETPPRPYIPPHDTPYFWLGRDAETWLD